MFPVLILEGGGGRTHLKVFEHRHRGFYSNRLIRYNSLGLQMFSIIYSIRKDILASYNVYSFIFMLYTCTSVHKYYKTFIEIETGNWSTYIYLYVFFLTNSSLFLTFVFVETNFISIIFVKFLESDNTECWNNGNKYFMCIPSAEHLLEPFLRTIWKTVLKMKASLVTQQ